MTRPHEVHSGWLSPIAAAFLLGVLPACSTTHHYVIQNVANPVRLVDSEAHAFRYVNVTEDDGELVIYGKIEHSHISCSSEGHIDMAIIGGDDTSPYTVSLPIVRRSSKQQGWYGAAFRARLPIRLAEGQVVHLTFHDDGCLTTETFDCQESRALAATGAPGVGASASDVGENPRR